MNLSYLNQNFSLGGYYIVEGMPRADWMDSKVLYESVLSASRCICNFYPDIDTIWSESKKKKETYRETLGLDNFVYDEMEQWINGEFENKFDFPDVFNNQESAVEFCNKFLRNIVGLRVIGIALPNKYRDAFLKDQDNLRYGICKNLSHPWSIDLDGNILGYEILGFEFGGFHSYICNGLESEYYEKYKIKLNKNGFISTLEEAEILADYTNNGIKGTESVLWLPWIILEYPLSN